MLIRCNDTPRFVRCGVFNAAGPHSLDRRVELAHRLEAVQTPLLERLRAYEQRIAELEKELGEQSKENRELLKLKIDLLRDQIETERSKSRVNFN